MRLMTKEQYEELINNIDKEVNNIWSKPFYQCPKCGGGMCKNLFTCISTCSIPPITSYEYRCEDCGYFEYLEG